MDKIVRGMNTLIKHRGRDINTTSAEWSQRLPSAHEPKQKRKLKQKSEGILLVPAYLAIHLGLNNLLMKENVRECIFLFYY